VYSIPHCLYIPEDVVAYHLPYSGSSSALAPRIFIHTLVTFSCKLFDSTNFQLGSDLAISKAILKLRVQDDLRTNPELMVLYARSDCLAQEQSAPFLPPDRLFLRMETILSLIFLSIYRLELKQGGVTCTTSLGPAWCIYSQNILKSVVVVRTYSGKHPVLLGPNTSITAFHPRWMKTFSSVKITLGPIFF
jgi:hypothetical protein